MSDSILEKNGTRRLRSLASKIHGRHGAMTADDLAQILKVSRLTILRRAKRGTIPSFRIGSCVRFDPANISKWLIQMGIRRMSK
jgi:excisionase family DNA binding protein